jgi:hypothetical protein
MKKENQKPSTINEPALPGNIPVEQLVKLAVRDAHKAIKKAASAARKKEGSKK